MTTLLVIVLACSALVAFSAGAFLARAIAQADDGFEDETGFHQRPRNYPVADVFIDIKITRVPSALGKRSSPADEAILI